MATPLKHTVYQYGSEHELQQLAVWEIDVSSTTKPWIIFIHGGAWRDPSITLESFVPTIEVLMSDVASFPGVSAKVAGFASIGYRLSPHPDHPQDFTTTPSCALRNARHPDHLDDVRQAVAWLHSRYAIGRRYMLIGHSAGACLAMQLAVNPHSVPLPRSFVGVAGIYDFTSINERLGGAFIGFLMGAFGDQTTWASIAPCTCSADFGAILAGSSVTLARSAADLLVDESELDNMAARLRHDGCDVAVIKDLPGGHDACWEDGLGLARLIWEVLEVW